ncbi:DUF1801 domain-containing protein [uncultured Rubinisphaera sp.]|uniref:DUF1801 domain-containing protein n=1 Tax=uncultured Rubinisphaera sp. TaxID=1678686 RepID=UPI0030DA3CB3
MNKKNPEVDQYITQSKQWQEELKQLRKIALDSQLVEELKWRVPCYTFQNRNVVLISELKNYCALSFFKGALLKDVQGILKKPGDNTQAARLIRFTSLEEILKLEPILNAYLEEAKEVEKAGLKVELKKTPEPVPEEVQQVFEKDRALKKAFEELTPGRQRAYLMFFAAAKQSKTRIARVKKYRSQILDGKGMNDCSCGLSKKLPSCDGSHKSLSR